MLEEVEPVAVQAVVEGVPQLADEPHHDDEAERQRQVAGVRLPLVRVGNNVHLRLEQECKIIISTL